MTKRSADELRFFVGPHLIAALKTFNGFAFPLEIEREVLKKLPNEDGLSITLQFLLHTLLEEGKVEVKTVPDPDPEHTLDRFKAHLSALNIEDPEYLKYIEKTPGTLRMYRLKPG